MQKLRIYLAKSNRANPTKVSLVRNLLKNSSTEIIEFKGGYYDNIPLMESDLLVIVAENPVTPGEDVLIGKGLFDQIKDFRYSHKDGPQPMFVSTIANSSILVVEAKNIRAIDSNNFVSFGYAKTEIFEKDLATIVTYALIDLQEEKNKRSLLKAAKFAYNYGYKGPIITSSTREVLTSIGRMTSLNYNPPQQIPKSSYFKPEDMKYIVSIDPYHDDPDIYLIAIPFL